MLSPDEPWPLLRPFQPSWSSVDYVATSFGWKSQSEYALSIHPYELGCVFLHTLLGMTAFIQQTQFALHIFPSTNLPYKQTRWALPQRMRCTSRLGISPSKGLLNLFHKENSQIKNHINKQSFFDLWTHQPNLHIFVLHPSPYGFFIFALALSG